MEGFCKLKLNGSFIPDSDYLNEKLASLNWKIFYVKGFISTYTYAYLLSQRRFPVTAYIRGKQNFDYSSQPDFMHDVLGHLPMLLTNDFSSLLSEWATKTLQAKIEPIDKRVFEETIFFISRKDKKHIDHVSVEKSEKKLQRILEKIDETPTRLRLLGNFFDWSFEFGVVRYNDTFKVFGGAIITSKKEMDNVCNNVKQFSVFKSETMLKAINYSSIQQEYFYVDNLSTYRAYLNKL